LARAVKITLGAWLAAFSYGGLGCSGAQPSLGPPAAAIATARVQSQDSPDRPRLALVEREGDPRRGVALAVHLATPPESALALALLVEERLRASGIESLKLRVSPTGFVAHALAADTPKLARFFQVANAALLSPVTANDAARVAARYRAEPPRVARSASEAALARCAGELLLSPASPPVPAPELQLGDWLAAVAVADVAFAVVGSRVHLSAAADAVSALGAWNRRGSPAAPHVEPEAVGMSASAEGALSLSLALSGASAARAIAVAEQIGEPESLLAVRLNAGFPAWQVARVSTHLEAGRACLRLDLRADGAAPSAEALAVSVDGAFDELEHTMGRLAPEPWVVAKQVLAAEAPQDAAAVAAWQALSALPPEPGPALHRLVHYAGPLAAPTAPERVAQLITAAAAAPANTAFEAVRGSEAGQGNVWMLLASPCGTGAEDAATAGTLALALHSTALAFSGRSGVVLEPWLNVDAMGILAHASAGAPHESATAQAERVAEVLARALLSSGPPSGAIAASREMLLATLADGPTPGLSLALRQVSANHPSWLDARGSWSTLSGVSSRSVELGRESFLRGKLRLASLGNLDDVQVEAGERRLGSLLRAADAGRGACVPSRRGLPAAGKYRLEVTRSSDADAIIAVPLPVAPDGLAEEARWTELLLNRTGGWLQQALFQPGLVSTARARAVGGAAAAALVIELRTLDGKREQAVAQVRGLFERLRQGAATPAEAQYAAEVSLAREADLELNPRARVVELWRGKQSRARSSANVESLRALHRAAFEAGREVVVLTDPPE